MIPDWMGWCGVGVMGVCYLGVILGFCLASLWLIGLCILVCLLTGLVISL